MAADQLFAGGTMASMGGIATAFGVLVVAAVTVTANDTSTPELTKVWLREGDRNAHGGGPIDRRWVMDGDGPNWVEFAGGVHGLRYTVGQQFAVQYINELRVPTSIHAHGLTPPHALDGVPFVDAPPIEPGRTAVFV
jgi:hypothetical protein